MSYLWYWPSGGWDFDAWRATQEWTPAPSVQTGRRRLAPLVEAGPPPSRWLCARGEWRHVTEELLGTVSDRPPARMQWEALEASDMPAYRRRRVRYRLTDHEWGYAWLLTPWSGDGARRPAVIALHQTVPQGKAEPVGLKGDPALAYGRELAERGFVVLAPDAVGFGERLAGHPHALYHSAEQFFRAHPHGSVMAKMIFDVRRGVDFLQALPEVDGGRLGCLGQSHGAYGTLFALIFEPRLRAGIVSCGFTTLRADPTPERWWRSTALIPRLGFFEGRIEQTPLDFHHLLALVAPRPLMVVAGLDDAIFPATANMPQVLRRVRDVYRVYGAANQLHRWVFRGGHAFPRQARRRAYQFLTHALEGPPL